MEERRKWREYGIHGANITVIVALVIGAGLVIYKPTYVPYGILAMTVALVAYLVGQALSYGIGSYRFVGNAKRGSTRFEHLQRWNRLKVSSALHSMLIGFGSVMILVGLASRIGLVPLNLDTHQVSRVVAIFVGVFGINATLAHHESLHVRLNPDRTSGTRVLFWVGLEIAGLVGVFGAYLAFFAQPLIVAGVLVMPADATVLLVAAFTLAGTSLMVGRGLPTMFALMTDPRTANRGGYASHAKSVLMPTMVAFTLLFVFTLLMLVFGTGIFTSLQSAQQSRSVVFVLVLMIVAVMAGIAFSIYLARQEDKVELYHVERSKEARIEMGIGVSSIVAGLILLGLAFMINTRGSFMGMRGEAWMTAAAFGLMLGLGPYGFYAGFKQRRINNMELRFPDFLRDLASSHKGGLTLVQSVQVAARGEYGALSAEIQRLADQLSWNVSFEEAFRRFGDRVKTPLVQRSVNLVLEASRSGGSTTDVLLAAARDAREIKTLERERKLNMSVYTTVIYVTFFVFLFVIGVLVGQFLPEIIKAGEASAESSLDAGSAGLNLGGISEGDYRQFYFIAGAVQAVGNGMLAGIMGSGSSSLGLRHAFFMVLSTWITFAFIL